MMVAGSILSESVKKKVYKPIYESLSLTDATKKIPKKKPLQRLSVSLQTSSTKSLSTPSHRQQALSQTPQRRKLSRYQGWLVLQSFICKQRRLSNPFLRQTVL
jgi:hypothetical protein